MLLVSFLFTQRISAGPLEIDTGALASPARINKIKRGKKLSRKQTFVERLINSVARDPRAEFVPGTLLPLRPGYSLSFLLLCSSAVKGRDPHHAALNIP